MRAVPLSVVVTDGRGRAVRIPGLAAWIARVAPRSVRGEVAIALVPDRAIRALNKQHRRRDYATDVLSFPTEAPRAPRSTSRTSKHPEHLKHPAHPEHPLHLGDIVIATGVARRQARAVGHSYTTELKVLALHGLLHLLGYDHHAASDRGQMARMERRLLAKGGLYEGLIKRANAVSEPRE